MERLSDLVDLYEYRVEDLAQGRTPKGGKRALLELRALLAQARLPAPLAKRFRQADARFRALRRGAEPSPPPDLPALLPGEPEGGEAPGKEVLRRLALGVWRLLAAREVRARAKDFLSGRREELRLVHAFLQNYLAYREQEGFRRDFNLSRFCLLYTSPSPRDS